MTKQEFYFLQAIADFGWSRAEYHWYYVCLCDSEADDVGRSSLRSSL